MKSPDFCPIPISRLCLIDWAFPKSVIGGTLVSQSEK